MVSGIESWAFSSWVGCWPLKLMGLLFIFHFQIPFSFRVNAVIFICHQLSCLPMMRITFYFSGVWSRVQINQQDVINGKSGGFLLTQLGPESGPLSLQWCSEPSGVVMSDVLLVWRKKTRAGNFGSGQTQSWLAACPLAAVVFRRAAPARAAAQTGLRDDLDLCGFCSGREIKLFTARCRTLSITWDLWRH